MHTTLHRLTQITLLLLLTAGALAAQTNIYDVTDPTTWDTPDWGGRPEGYTEPDGGFTITLPAGRPWAAINRTIDVDVDQYPVLAVNVTGITPGASFVLKLDNKPYDTTKPYDVQPIPAGGDKPGIYTVDLRALVGWSGQQSIDIRLFVVGTPNARIRISKVLLIPARYLGENTFTSSNADPSQTCLASGSSVIYYRPAEGRFTIWRPGEIGAVTGLLPAGTTVTADELRQENGNNVAIIRSTTDWANIETRITAYKAPANLFRWTVNVEVTKPHAFSPTAPECRYVTAPILPAELDVNPGTPVYSLPYHQRIEQKGWETGSIFCDFDPALGAPSLYYQNFTSLNPYFQAERASAKETVKIQGDTFGCAMPADPNIQLPAGTRLCLTDAFFMLDDTLAAAQQAADTTANCATYLNMIAGIYDIIPKPETTPTDWHDIAQKTIADLAKPDPWCNIEKGYLRNYINEPWGPDTAELTVQLDPYLGALIYKEKWGGAAEIINRITPTLPLFYSEKTRLLRDYSTDQDGTHLDTGWLIYLPTILAYAAKHDIPEARDLLLSVLPKTIALGRKCNYEFPLFINAVDLSHFEWSIPDAAGAYAYLMLDAYELLKDPAYLAEAQAALQHISHHQLNLAYEMHFTASAAAACARMWKITGDYRYIQLSSVPIANIIRHSRLWDCRYGYHTDHHLFLGLSCMPGQYIAPYELHHPWRLLREYDAIAHDVLPESIKTLVAETIKYTPTVLRNTLPPLMTPGSAMQTNERGRANNLSLYIPVEDLNDGWTQSGKIGQEIYGAGAPLVIAGEAYTKVEEAGISIYAEYPIREVRWNPTQHTLRIKLNGTPKYNSIVEVKYDKAKTGWPESAKLQITAQAATDRTDGENTLRLRIPGESELTIKPK